MRLSVRTPSRPWSAGSPLGIEHFAALVKACPLPVWRRVSHLLQACCHRAAGEGRSVSYVSLRDAGDLAPALP